MIDEYDDDDRRPAGRRPGEMPGSPRAALRKRSPNRQTETKSRKERSYELFGLTALKPEVKKKQPRDGKSMRPLDAARIRKERRKVVALQADDEITSFRGTVCCACTCMVLQTGKLYEYLLDPTAESGRLGETPAAGAGGAIEEQARAAGVMRPGVRGEQWRYRMYSDVIHAEFVEEHQIFSTEGRRESVTFGQLATKHVFFFQYGCLVFWGLEDEERQYFQEMVQPYEADALEDEAKEWDEMRYFYALVEGVSSKMINDKIRLASTEPLEKLSMSFALAQSSKLSVLESRVEETFESTRRFPQELAEHGHIKVDQQHVSQLIGQVFIVKAQVNLESDMLSTPDFFWEREDKWEPIFRQAGWYLEIKARVEVLDARIVVLDGMLHMLKDQLEVMHSTRLELIIIWLLVLQVAIFFVWNICVRDFFDLIHHNITAT